MAELTPQAYLDALPHARALNMRFDGMHNGKVRISMPYNPALIGDPTTGVMHGGAVYALLDTASGIAVTTHPVSGGGTATLDLRIDYMRAATPGQRICAEAFCYNMTRTVAFVRAVAYDDNTEKPVATATGAFTNEHVNRSLAE
ncbi:PaaI family thioesterase [Falsigemmobacter intermedius]|uniref:PaaI family thioesterase n=1 Tax=Falsigemmobacter intermedius TaxID=1553448 RepID=A0A3S3VWE2_9RHOB|nr:PaaI family thioesterase [Falsigemmobacter intermedius]RWY43326.1 PaaI family thioesterase [Falsigemmobacter intermedius]